MNNGWNILAVLILMIFSQMCFCQNQSAIWYFGKNAGLDFRNNQVNVLTDGAMYAREGCATVSDSLGNLLFYTNGINIWNREHQQMPNGFGLKGDTSSTQSAIIIPIPDTTNRYAIFTADDLGGINGIGYSIVDMQINNNFGDVTEKNHKLFFPAEEKLTAVKHKNKRDYWVITKAWRTDSFFTYRITKDGVNENPVISEAGFSFGMDSDLGNTLGCLKVSPDGKLLVSIHAFNGICELLSFDDSTGEIKLLKYLDMPFHWPYGAEFSPDSRKLYISTLYEILQYDISEIKPDNPIEPVLIGQNFDIEFSTLQLAIDGRIYIAQHPPHAPFEHPVSNYLSVINRPNEPDSLCDFEFNGLYLNGKGCLLGLPAFVQSYFISKPFRAEQYCFGDSTRFTNSHKYGVDSIIWNFDDAKSGSENLSNDIDPVHRFSWPGSYTVSRIMYLKQFTDTASTKITINPLPMFDLGNDTTICNGKNIVISASYIDSMSLSNRPDTNIIEFDWYESESNDSIISVNKAGIYKTTVRNIFGCDNIDSIMVNVQQLPIPNIGNDTTICLGDSILLKPTNEFYNYYWNNDSTDKAIWLSKAGEYILIVSDSIGCTGSDSMTLNILDPPYVNLGPDKEALDGETVELSIDNYDFETLWSTNETSSSITINKTGNYWVRLSNECGIDMDTVYVKFKITEIEIPNVVTSNTPFRIGNIGNQVWELFIYNRWGRRLYHDDNYTEAHNSQNEGHKLWSGVDYKGKKLAPGVYFYILKHKATKEIKTGYVYVF